MIDIAGNMTNKLMADWKNLPNQERYIETDLIWEALDEEVVVLLRGKWMLESARMEQVLARRQELPVGALMPAAELKSIWINPLNFHRTLPIVSISYCWMSPGHPDPEGKQEIILEGRSN